MKKFGPRQQGGGAGLKIVGHLNLGGRERVMVIEVGDQWIVVGAAPGRVNALATMPKGEGAAMLSPHEPSSPNFSDWLKKTIDRRNGKQE
jgi:flagellar protein FliO/FliZ